MGRQSQQTREEWEAMEIPVTITYSILCSFFIGSGIFCIVLFSYLRRHPMIRFRTPCLTIFAAIMGMILAFYNSIRMILPGTIPCWTQLWIPMVVTPLYMCANCCRAWRLVALYRIAEASVLGMQLISNKSEDSTYNILCRDECASKNVIQRVPNCHSSCSVQASYDIKEKEKAEAEAEAEEEHCSPLTPYPHTPLFPKPIPKMSVITQWILRHRDLVQTSVLWRIMAVIGGMLILLTLIVHLLSSTIQGGAIPAKYSSACRLNWEVYPLMVLEITIIVLFAPFFFYFLHGINDTFGIQRELMWLWVSWMIGLTAYIAGSLLLPNKGPFPPICYQLVVLFVNNVFSVFLPIACILQEKYKQKQVRRNLRKETLSTQNHKSLATCDTVNPQGISENTLSRAFFHALLNDKLAFEQFKAFTVRDLSVENMLFYDACRKIREYADRKPAMPSEHHLLDDYNERLCMYLFWLRNTFLLDTSEHQVNLSDSQQRMLLEMINGDISDFDAKVLHAAQDEVETLMFFDTYLRYLSSHPVINLSETMPPDYHDRELQSQMTAVSFV